MIKNLMPKFINWILDKEIMKCITEFRKRLNEEARVIGNNIRNGLGDKISGPLYWRKPSASPLSYDDVQRIYDNRLKKIDLLKVVTEGLLVTSFLPCLLTVGLSLGAVWNSGKLAYTGNPEMELVAEENAKARTTVKSLEREIAEEKEKYPYRLKQLDEQIGIVEKESALAIMRSKLDNIQKTSQYERYSERKRSIEIYSLALFALSFLGMYAAGKLLDNLPLWEDLIKDRTKKKLEKKYSVKIFE